MTNDPISVPLLGMFSLPFFPPLRCLHMVRFLLNLKFSAQPEISSRKADSQTSVWRPLPHVATLPPPLPISCGLNYWLCERWEGNGDICHSPMCMSVTLTRGFSLGSIISWPSPQAYWVRISEGGTQESAFQKPCRWFWWMLNFEKHLYSEMPGTGRWSVNKYIHKS